MADLMGDIGPFRLAIALSAFVGLYVTLFWEAHPKPKPKPKHNPHPRPPVDLNRPYPNSSRRKTMAMLRKRRVLRSNCTRQRQR